MVLKGGHRDALPPRKGRNGRKRGREMEAHSLQGVSQEGVKEWKRLKGPRSAHFSHFFKLHHFIKHFTLN